MKLTLHKDKRIKKKRIFDALFKSGQSKMAYPIRMNWVDSSALTSEPLKAAFVVPKRLFRSAVDRNALKRKMKEAYRLNQTELLETLKQGDKQCSVLFIYQAKTKMSFTQIEKAMKKGLQKIISLHDLA